MAVATATDAVHSTASDGTERIDHDPRLLP